MRAPVSSALASPEPHRQFSAKAVERHHNRLHDRAQLATLCDSLAAADLTATSYRVMLDTLARMLRRDCHTEAVGNEWIARRLNVGRNAVSNAYNTLETGGFLRRVAVYHRGAPTRTRLVGIAAQLIGNLPAGEQPEPVSIAGEGAGQTIEHSEAMLRAPHPVALNIAKEEPTGVTANEEAQKNGEAGQNSDPAQTVLAFKFNPRVFRSMAEKVPTEFRARACAARSTKELTVLDEWRLTPDESEHYFRLVPPDARVPPKNCSPHVTCAGVLASPQVALALWEALPGLQAKAGSKAAAAVLADEIAFQVERGGLGKNDGMAAGVRVGLWLVRQGRWSKPKGFLSAEWSGAVMRGVIAASSEKASDARKSVH